MPLLYLALSYMIGIALGSWLWQQGIIDCDLPTWLWILPLLPLLPLLWWDRRRAPAVSLRWPLSAGFEPPRPQMTPLLLFAIGLVLMAGLLRYGSRPSLPCWTHTDLAYYNSLPDDPQARQVSVVGTVSSYPLLKDGRQRLHLNVESIVIDGESRAVSGQLRLTASQRPRYRYGDRLQATGILVTPPKFDGFDYRAYLSRWGVHSLLQRPRLGLLPGEGGDRLMHGIYALRQRGEVLINRMLPEPYAALLNGMLLGIESGIPDDLYDQFNLTGTSHVIVISGWNLNQKW